MRRGEKKEEEEEEGEEEVKCHTCLLVIIDTHKNLRCKSIVSIYSV